MSLSRGFCTGVPCLRGPLRPRLLFFCLGPLSTFCFPLSSLSWLDLQAQATCVADELTMHPSRPRSSPLNPTSRFCGFWSFGRLKKLVGTLAFPPSPCASPFLSGRDNEQANRRQARTHTHTHESGRRGVFCSHPLYRLCFSLVLFCPFV